MMLEQGQVLDERYEIDTLIGQGGMSYVYRANDRKMGRVVAIKVLKEEYCEDEDFIRKFQNEAQAAAKLNHPNIVAVYDIVDNPETKLHYIVMELVEGITLKNYIKRAGRMDSQETIAIALQAAAGIELAHKMGIVHRDIKPQNIIVDSEGNVKVADFGIARAATQQTVNATVMGSVHYISPEQARSGQSDERSDIYSFGCTMYEMLTGQVPYDGDTSVSVVFAHLENPIPHVKDLVPDVYPALDMAVYKCMQKKGKLRYQHIGELMEDLRKALKDPSGSFMSGEMPEDLSETRVLSPRELNQLKHRQKLRKKLAHLDDTDALPLDDTEEDETSFHMTKIYRVIAGICILLIIVLVLIIGRNMFSFFRDSRTALETSLPIEESSAATEAATINITISALDNLLTNILGKTVEEAEDYLGAYNIHLRTVKESFSNQYPTEGTIVAYQKEKIQSGSTLDVTVSKGAETIRFYDPATPEKLDALHAVKCDTLVEALEKRKINYKIQDAFSDTVPLGNIISTNKPDTSGTSMLIITRSAGSASENGMALVPELRTLSEDDALTALENAGLTLDGIDYVPDEAHEADTVIDQSLTPGSVVLKGTTISLTVSSGSDGETSQKSTVADSQGAWYGSINTAVKIGGETSPAADTRRIILIRLCQEIDGAERYTTLQEARSYEAGTELQVVIPNIRGAAGIGKGTVEIVDASNDTVIASYTVNFAPRS